MGFDFSFHPVRPEEEGAMIRDLLAGKRTAREIAQALPNCMGDSPAIVEENLSLLLKNWAKQNTWVASTASFMAGLLSGYLRPYWYSRGQALSIWLDDGKVERNMFTPFLQWLGPPFDQQPDPTKGLVPENYAGSGVITDPREFLEWLDEQDDERLDICASEALRNCAEYSVRHACQMIEVADVCGSTNPANLRSYYLGD
jgi:hypothetical protein